MKDNKLMSIATLKEAKDPGDGDDVENIGQRVLNEMMEYLKNISSKPGKNKLVEMPTEKLKQGFCCN